MVCFGSGFADLLWVFGVTVFVWIFTAGPAPAPAPSPAPAPEPPKPRPAPAMSIFDQLNNPNLRAGLKPAKERSTEKAAPASAMSEMQRKLQSKFKNARPEEEEDDDVDTDAVMMHVDARNEVINDKVMLGQCLLQKHVVVGLFPVVPVPAAVDPERAPGSRSSEDPW
jgi:hypothetical protein